MALTDESNGTGMYMPVAPIGGYYGGNQGGMGFGGDWFAWLILAMLIGVGWGMGGFGGGWGGMMGMGFDFPWLLNGQNGINNNVNDGFHSAQLSDAVTSVRDGMRGGSYRGSYARNGRGRGRNARRDSMGRYSSEGYSRAADDALSKMHEMMRTAPDEQTRSEVQRMINRLEQM